MQTPNLWAPWRMDYIKGLTDQPTATPQEAIPPACFLCEGVKLTPGTDAARRHLILLRDERGIILLNRYPYTSGHLLIAVADHLPDLTDLTPAQRAGLLELTAVAEQIVRLAYNPQGLNIGVNIGRCAGAGIPGHLHLHVVPRWAGDTNYMQVIGQVRVIPQALEASYEQLSATTKKLGL